MATVSFGLPSGPVDTFSIFFTTSRDAASSTSPNTTCLPSSHGHGTVVMKNWHPFVSLPLFACEAHARA